MTSEMDSKAAYLVLYESGELGLRKECLLSLLEECTLCPRECRVNRLRGELGFCRTGRMASVASYGPHFGEEFPLVGRHGSGTVFFNGCNLGCIFCQNYDISHQGRGEEVDPGTLSSIFLEIKRMGCNNLNLVTPTHVIPQVIEALELAAGRGFNLPLVYNCGGYESKEVLKILDGIIDIYMPDMKFMDDRIALELTGAQFYGKHVRESVIEMHRQAGDLVTTIDGIARKGLIVRHLLLPDGISGTKEVVEFLANEISIHTYLNIMGQYHPCYRAREYPGLERRIHEGELVIAVDLAKRRGFTRLDGPPC